MNFNLITIFPDIFDSYINRGIVRRAQDKDIVQIKVHDLRDYTHDKHKTVDDKPYGGGPGLILKVKPIYDCLSDIAGKGFLKRDAKSKKKMKIVMLDPGGKTFDQKMANKFSKLDRIIFLCGRYEGFDHRVTKLVDERVSIGDYVLSGGELAALVVMESVTRLIPNVIGHYKEVLSEETFSFEKENMVEYPQYTRPEKFSPDGKTEWNVPKVLTSGHHGRIKKWRSEKIRRKR